MMTLALGPSWLDPNYLLDTYSIWGLLLIVFAESGLLIGFFLPGDSLLFTCGLLITSHQLDFPLWGAIALICVAAILGDQAGYMFGKKVGPSLFNRPDSRLFKQENVTKAHEFFEKYGPKSLILARFVPVVRTFTPIIAGVSGMRYRSFLTFNVIGGTLWGAGVTLLGSWLGNIGFVKNNIEAILILIVLVSVVPIGIEYLRARGKEKKGARDQERPRPARAEAPRPQYQPPMTDDATTRLRRIEPDEPRPYGQQQYGGGQYGDQGPDQAYGDQGYDGRQYGHQQPQQPQQPQPHQQPQPQYQQPQYQQPRQQDWNQRQPYYDPRQYPQQGQAPQGQYPPHQDQGGHPYDQRDR
ncbi:DedA family protein [Streptomyces sp. F-1]|uniref:DedA family protein n=1 Tax=Streptomyces sp. F-1 TaxID=463642 RepID=UPI00085BC317|nr:VTT domain-containing protein [Streptomyces sp. F-1]SFY52802.1 putative membrane protein [Streptomyces sp. F-1]